MTSILVFVIVGFIVPTIIWFKYEKRCVITKHTYYIGMIHTILYSLVPFGLMLLANVAIITKLMYIKYKGISHTNESVSKSSTRGSVMVVTVSLAFIILTCPRAVDSALQYKLSAHPLGSPFVITFQYLNHSINGILYCIFGQKFRNELSKTVPCCRRKMSRCSNTNFVSSNTTSNTIAVTPLQHTKTISSYSKGPESQDDPEGP